MMADQAGIEIEFEDCNSDSESDETENENDKTGDFDDSCIGMCSQLIFLIIIIFTKFLHKDIASSCKADKDEQKRGIGEERTSLQHIELSHSTEAPKLSLTSLLTSSDCGTSHMITSLPPSTEITTAILTDPNQSLHQNFKSPQTTSTLLTHRRALGSNFNGHNIEKSMRLNESDHQQATSDINTNLSADIESESRTNILLHTCDTNSSSSDITSLDISAVKPPSEVSKAGPASEWDNVHAPDTDSSASTSRTRTVGLMDLLTTAVEDNNSSVVSEDKWISPHVIKEVRVSILSYRATILCLSYADAVCKKISKETTSR